MNKPTIDELYRSFDARYCGKDLEMFVPGCEGYYVFGMRNGEVQLMHSIRRVLTDSGYAAVLGPEIQDFHKDPVTWCLACDAEATWERSERRSWK